MCDFFSPNPRLFLLLFFNSLLQYWAVNLKQSQKQSKQKLKKRNGVCHFRLVVGDQESFIHLLNTCFSVCGL